MKIFKTLVIRQTPNNLMITLLAHNNKLIRWTSIRRKQRRWKKNFGYKTTLELSRIFIRYLVKSKSIIKNFIFRGQINNPKNIIKTFLENEIKILQISFDVQPPHNGCKLAKKRRVGLVRKKRLYRVRAMYPQK